MKQIRYKHVERLAFVKSNHPDVWELVEPELDYPDRCVEIMNSHNIPHGYEPEPISASVLTCRIRNAIAVLGADCPGRSFPEIMIREVVWIKVDNASVNKRRYTFQLDSGDILTETIKVTPERAIQQQYFNKYVMKEGGNFAGVKIN